ncbi:MAG: aminopeptidase [Bacteroidales bacterium]|nr:aminopeptidase [Bacteroidales bacterium]
MSPKIISVYTYLILPVFLVHTPCQTSHTNINPETSSFEFTTKIAASPVKNQGRTNTCWCFATISLIESDLLRLTGKTYDLSEMFIIRKVYLEKAERYIRMHGHMNFAGGGEPDNVIDVIKKYGIMPESAYSGLKNDSLQHNHHLMDLELKQFVSDVVKNPEKNLNKNWKEKFEAIMDRHIGHVPETFTFEESEHTAKSFAGTLNLNFDNYILITSFNHHPYYQSFILEVPDNWSCGSFYNVPPGELKKIVQHALINGHSAVWAADYSETGFDHRAGMAVAPKMLYKNGEKRSITKLQRYSAEERDKYFFDLSQPVNEIIADSLNRQEAFDNYASTDDHAMHIVGQAKGINGKTYFYVKNSWGTNNKFGGYLFISEAYFNYKTISLMVDKNYLPDETKELLSSKNARDCF